MWFPRLGLKNHRGLHPAVLDHSLRGKPDNMLWGHSRRPMARPMWQGTQASCQLSATTCQAHEPSVRQPQSNLPTAVALADTLTTIAWEALPQNRLVSRARETVWADKCLLLASAAKFWVNCYTVIDHFIMEVWVNLSLNTPTGMILWQINQSPWLSLCKVGIRICLSGMRWGVNNSICRASKKWKKLTQNIGVWCFRREAGRRCCSIFSLRP